MRHKNNRITESLKTLFKKENAVQWMFVFIISVLCYVSFNHGDITWTATNGKDLLECVLSGNFWGFYDYATDAYYSIVIYLVFMVWSIPVYLLYRVLGIQLWATGQYQNVNFPLLMWYKLLPTLCFVAVAYIIYKIIFDLTQKRRIANWVALLFCGSSISIFSQFIFGQYDSLGLFLTMCALYSYLKKRYLLFSVFCSIAITFKLFTILLFFPLIFLVMKKPIQIIKHTIIAISGYVITNVMFIHSPGFQRTISWNGDLLSNLFDVGIGTNMGTISLFAFGYIALCVMSYNKRIEHEYERYYYALFLSFATYGVLFCFVVWHPQWVLLLVPFMSMALLLNKRTNATLILQFVMSMAYIVLSVICYPNNVDANLANRGILNWLFGWVNSDSLTGLYFLGGKLGHSFYYSLFAVSVLIIIIMCVPTQENLLYFSKLIKGEEVLEYDRTYSVIRPLAVLVYVIPALVLLIV